jgi:hypothetical protein
LGLGGECVALRSLIHAFHIPLISVGGFAVQCYS